MTTNQIPDDLAQRLNKMRRLVNALSVSIDSIEAEMLERYAPRTDAERAARLAHNGVYQAGPQEVKTVDSNAIMR